MQHLESPFCHVKEVVDAKIPFHLCYVHLCSLGNYSITSLFIGNFMRVRVPSVERTWLGLEWPPA